MKGYDPTNVMMWYLKDGDKLQAFIELQQVLAACVDLILCLFYFLSLLLRDRHTNLLSVVV